MVHSKGKPSEPLFLGGGCVEQGEQGCGLMAGASLVQACPEAKAEQTGLSENFIEINHNFRK